MTTVFISHSTKDCAFAREKLRAYLENCGIKTWFSDVDTSPGADWERKIRSALSNAQWYVVVLSPDSVRSDWVQTEVHWALEKRKGRVIPVMIEGCDPADLHLKLLRIHYLDFRQDFDAAAERLLQILQSNRRTDDTDSALDESEQDATIVLNITETVLSFRVTGGPQEESQLTARFRRNCVIGRAKSANLRILDDLVSRRHADISVASRKGEKQLLITDLGSANGTFVNENRIAAPTPMQEGDVIGVGKTQLTLEHMT
jgi:hypothetical protein